MFDIKKYKKLKENKCIKIKEIDDRYIATIKIYNVYTGKTETEEVDIDKREYEMKRDELQDEIVQFQSNLDIVNLLLDDIKKLNKLI